MSPLLVKAGQGQTIVEVTPESAGWTHVGFAAHRLAAGEHISLETGKRELCIVVLTGTVTVRARPASAWPCLCCSWAAPSASCCAATWARASA